jgi:hypothetical protein
MIHCIYNIQQQQKAMCMGKSTGFDSIRTSRLALDSIRTSRLRFASFRTSRFPHFFGRRRRTEAAPTQKQYRYVQGQTIWTLLSFFFTGFTTRTRTGSNRTVLS